MVISSISQANAHLNVTLFAPIVLFASPATMQTGHVAYLTEMTVATRNVQNVSTGTIAQDRALD